MKMPEIRSNEEYSALLKEMDSTKKERDKAEDRSLKDMERLEEIEKEIPALEEAYQTGDPRSRRSARPWAWNKSASPPSSWL